jgi:hypothetical protein
LKTPDRETCTELFTGMPVTMKGSLIAVDIEPYQHVILKIAR